MLCTRSDGGACPVSLPSEAENELFPRENSRNRRCQVQALSAENLLLWIVKAAVVMRSQRKVVDGMWLRGMDSRG